jgi:hypothetical protein
MMINVHNYDIYLIGTNRGAAGTNIREYTTDEIYLYRPDIDEWFDTLWRLPHSLTKFAAQYIEPFLYIIGNILIIRLPFVTCNECNCAKHLYLFVYMRCTRGVCVYRSAAGHHIAGNYQSFE